MNKLIKCIYLYFHNLHVSLSGMPWPAIKRIKKLSLTNKNWQNIKWKCKYGIYKQND